MADDERMDFTQAHLSVLDPSEYRYRDTDVSFTSGKKGENGRKHKTWVEMFPTNSNDFRMPTHEVRHYSNHVLPHCEGPTILDQHEVWGGHVRIIGSRLVLTGFARGINGKVKDGKPEPGDWNSPDPDENEPFVGVEWALVP